MYTQYLITIGLFVALTPGVLLRIPAAGDKITVALVHAVVFAILYTLIGRYAKTMECFLPNTKVDGNCPAGSTRDGVECRLP